MLIEKDKKAQIWVETVVYTLIGLAIIGIVLAIATPKIKEMTDRAVLEQTLSVLSDFNKEINIVVSATGNSRLATFKIKKGEFIIDSKNETISYVMKDTSLKYSQPDSEIKQGDIIILTQEKNGKYIISLSLQYAGSLNITYEDKDDVKTFTQAPTAYQILIKNKGSKQIDISLI